LSKATVPVVATIIGEGGSGGALAIALADRVIMAENAVYSVASPEGCAAILWGDAARAPEAAEHLKLTSADLLGFGIVDRRSSANRWAAHIATPRASSKNRSRYDRRRVAQARGNAAGGLRERRYAKFRRIGAWERKNVARHATALT
jgi:acetyl-CoA carboxylase carboxyl transferase subunit alpha